MPDDRPGGVPSATDGQGPPEATLLRPPPVEARLLRPPGPPAAPPPPPGRRTLGRLLADGLRAASRAPLVVAGIFVCRTLEAVGAIAPLIFVWARLAAPISNGDLPLALSTFVSPVTWIVPAGILVATLIVTAILELVVWSGGICVLDRVVRREEPVRAVATFANAFGPTFPRLVIVAACMAAARVGLALFTWTLGLAAGWTMAGGHAGIAIVAAAGLSLAAVVGLAGSIFLPIVHELALARSAVLAEPPLAAIHGAGVQVARRPFVLVGVAFVVGLGAAVVAGTTGGPAQLLFEGGAWIVAAVAGSQLIAFAIAAFASVARLGAWVSSARDAQAVEGIA